MDHNLFVKDTVGNIEAAKYGGPAKGPRFKRTGAGRVLGLAEGLRIVHGSNCNSLEIAPGGRKRARYVDSGAKSIVHTTKLKRLKTSSSQASSFGTEKSFVPIAKKRQDKVNVERDTYLGHEFAGTNRSTHSSDHNDEASQSGSSVDESSDSSTLSSQQELQERLKVLDLKVRKDGGDIDSWLALVDIQEEVVNMAVGQEKTKSERADLDPSKRSSKIQHSVVEVKMSVLERASNALPKNAASLPLIMAKLDLAASSRIWDTSKTEREWRQAIFTCSSTWNDFTKLWNGFLAWKMKGHETFVLKDMISTFEEALEAFRRAIFEELEPDFKSIKEEAALYLIKQVVEVLLHAGYVERAHGLLQALSELTFRRPDGLNINTQESFGAACVFLRDYWDLEEHRMGEAASPGWSSFQENMKKHPESLIKTITKDSNASFTLGSFIKELDDPDPIVRWLALEEARAALRHFSAKEGDEADWGTGELEVDPFSTVLFSDIAPFLLPIESRRGKNLLVDLFLSVLGAPWSVTGSDCKNVILPIAQAELIWPSHLDGDTAASSWDFIDGEMMPRQKMSTLIDPFKIPIKTWKARLDSSFPIQVAEVEPWFVTWQGLRKENAIIAETYLQQIKQPSTQVALARLGLSEASQSHKAAKKLAKMLLNIDRENVVLWRAFARLERNNGNLESARIVYMSLLVADHSAKELAPAWAEWAELEWEAGELDTSLSILTIAAKHTFARTQSSSLTNLKHITVPAMEVLRTRRTLDQLLKSPDCNQHHVFCDALFQYLSQNPDEAFESAMEVFDKFINVNLNKEEMEDIAMTHCKFIWRHIHGNARMRRSRMYIPRYVTATFSRYVIDYPHNSGFVSLLAAFEMTTKVENVLRKVLEEKMQKSKDNASEHDWLVYLYCELHMNLHLVNENAVRRLFERALQSKSTSASSLLWQLYLQFEVKVSQRNVNIVAKTQSRIQGDQAIINKETLKEVLKNDQRQCKAALIRTKSILYRAIQKVPYCKALYLTAFALPLRQVFPLDELLQLHQVMQEKDLRFYTDLTAFVTPFIEAFQP